MGLLLLSLLKMASAPPAFFKKVKPLLASSFESLTKITEFLIDLDYQSFCICSLSQCLKFFQPVKLISLKRVPIDCS